MATLNVTLTADGAAGEEAAVLLQAVLDYTRIVRSGGADEAGAQVPDETGPKQRQIVLSGELDARILISDYADETPVSCAIVDGQGIALIVFPDRQPVFDRATDTWVLKLELSAADVAKVVAATTPKKPEVRLIISARVEFKPTIELALHFPDYTLVVAPVEAALLPEAKRTEYFGSDSGPVSSAQTDRQPNEFLSDLGAQSLHSVAVSLQGRSEFTLPRRAQDDAWLWVLSGPITFVGIVPDGFPADLRRTLWLPVAAGDGAAASAAAQGAGDGGPATPLDPSEQELIESPDLFADDPGTSCRPFQSPNRIVGEKTFHTVLRVTQPEIGTDPAAPRPPRPRDLAERFGLDASVFVAAAAAQPSRPGDSDGGRSITRRVTSSVLKNLATMTHAITTSVSTRATDVELPPAAELVARERAQILQNSQGRRVISGGSILDWEDSTPAQAESLAYGHVLDYRVRWRNNGYSFGKVAYSLALAPRQTKQIVTIQSGIVDRVRREETTTLSDEISQETTRDYGYTDAVRASLSEWAKGGSSSSTTGAAGGIGMAIGPVVLGGGASHGRADSSSWQEGGRNVTALEEQSLRDAIRQHGDSLRELHSVVVQEQTQDESVKAVSETIRNPNYCHSLTVVYHEILRHLRVDTEVAGARECVFVPLPIKPFTWARMIRWRDSLAQALTVRSLRWVLPYLEDVESDFADSLVPEGRRADQPVTYVLGSIYLQLAIERPQDDDDEFDQVRWRRIGPFMNRPVREVIAHLRPNVERRDEIFQKEYAPAVARTWVENLTLSAGATPLTGADMTLATRYTYNRTQRVDFTYVPDRRLTRADLERISVAVANDAALPPGSVADVRSVKLRYYTGDFEREKSSAQASHDLISIADGTPTAGADLQLPLDDWETKNQRELIRSAADKLRKHLNEHMEYYHKHIWWNMDRDKLYMLLDTAYVLSKADGRSVASVVERSPMAILGNSLVYRVAGGAHLGINGHQTPADLDAYYRDSVVRSEPIRISLPTAGVYAQALMDDCNACEEHFGGTEWILGDQEPELAELSPGLLASRRASTPDVTPTDLPGSIINLQNAPNVPAPSGFGGALGLLGNAGAFRDMAGLAGTQANAKAAMETAAELATSFGNQAAEIRKAEIASKVAQEKLAVVKKAKDSGAVAGPKAEEAASKIIDDMTGRGPEEEESLDAEEIDKIAKTAEDQDVDIEVDQKKKQVKVTPGGGRRAKKKPVTRTNVAIYCRDIEGRPLTGSFMVKLGAFGPEKFDVTQVDPVIRIEDLDLDASKEITLMVAGDPVVSPGSDLIAVGAEFYFFCVEPVFVSKNENVVVFLQQARAKVALEFDEEKSDTEVATHAIGGEVGFESGAIAAVLAGKLSANIKYTYTSEASSTSSTGFLHRYEVFYPRRKLKFKQRHQESTAIDADE